MWTTWRFHVLGCGIIQTKRASSRQATTTTCLFDTLFLTLAGMYLTVHLEGAGEVQNEDADEIEVVEEEAEDSPEGKVKVGIRICEGVARSLGDLSMNGSDVFESFHTARSRKPISSGLGTTL